MQKRWMIVAVAILMLGGVLHFAARFRPGQLPRNGSADHAWREDPALLRKGDTDLISTLTAKIAKSSAASGDAGQTSKRPFGAVLGSEPKGDSNINAKVLVEEALTRLEASSDALADASTLLASPEGKVREAVGAFLAKSGTAEAVSLLVGAIKGEQDPKVRENLIESLRHVSNPDAIPALAEQAQDLSDLALHRVCRNAISAMTDPAAVSQLIAMLDRGGSDPSLEPIEYALSRMTSSNALTGLIDGASSENERVANACIKGLGNLGSPEAYLALLELIGRFDGSERSQIAAVVANQTALEKKDNRFIEVCLRVISTTSSVKAWQTAVDGLVAIPSTEALAALEGQMRGETNNEIVAYLQQAIARHSKLWPAQAAGLGTTKTP
jgi:HEAT repeat protein